MNHNLRKWYRCYLLIFSWITFFGLQTNQLLGQHLFQNKSLQLYIGLQKLYNLCSEKLDTPTFFKAKIYNNIHTYNINLKSTTSIKVIKYTKQFKIISAFKISEFFTLDNVYDKPMFNIKNAKCNYLTIIETQNTGASCNFVFNKLLNSLQYV